MDHADEMRIPGVKSSRAQSQVSVDDQGDENNDNPELRVCRQVLDESDYFYGLLDFFAPGNLAMLALSGK